jgi:TetR/AcrR family transcriptional regulator, tetracycline repressor protein
MRYRREDLVTRALLVLDDHGLPDLTMRRLGSELGLQPSALYHHFPNKQALLAAVADEILDRGARPLPEGAWDAQARHTCHALRDACLAWRDGAEVVATARAFGLGGAAPYDELVGVLVAGGVDDELAATAARTLLHFVLGHAMDEQLQRQAGSAGAQLAAAASDPLRDFTTEVTTGVELVLAGLRARVG